MNTKLGRASLVGPAPIHQKKILNIKKSKEKKIRTKETNNKIEKLTIDFWNMRYLGPLWAAVFIASQPLWKSLHAVKVPY